MGTIKITKGEWYIHNNGYYLEIKLKDNFIGEISNSQYPSLKSCAVKSKEETEANVKLMVDAGNTANKCGLLPSELLKQRDELLEACTLILEQINNQTTLVRVDLLEDAINNTK